MPEDVDVYIARMEDIEVWKGIVEHYTQGEVSTIKQARPRRSGVFR